MYPIVHRLVRLVAGAPSWPAQLSLALLIAAGQPALAQLAGPSAEIERLQQAASDLYKAGSHQQALDVARRTLELIERTFGRDHERVAIQTYSLGLIAEAAGQLDAAADYYRNSVRVRETIYGLDSAGTAQALEKLATLALRLGRTDDAAAHYSRVLRIRSELVGGQHAFTASARAGLGAVESARRNFAAALTHYREAVRLLATQTTSQTLARSVIDDEIRRHKPVFTGLAHAAWESARSTTADRNALLSESFAASQQSWATSAASALARMSARLGQADTPLGRRIRTMQDLSERVLAMHRADMKELAAWHKVQRSSARYTTLLEEFRQASISQSRDTAPVVARQRALVESLQALLARCPPGRANTGCANADADREAITRELSQLSAQTSKRSGRLMDIHRRMQAVERTLPGYASHTSTRSKRLAEMSRLERAQLDERARIVAAFPDYVALTEPQPLPPKEVQALLQPDEALVTVLIGERRSFVWAVTRQRAQWAMIDAGESEIAAHVAAIRRGLDPPAADVKAGITPRFDLARAHALYRLLFGPVAIELAGKQHLIVVPTGPLTSLPLHVLLTDPPRGGDDHARALKEAKWLLRRHALSVLPSVQSLAALRRLAPASAPPRPFLGIGDPIFAPPRPGQSPRPRGAPSAVPSIATAYRNGKPDLRALAGLSPLPETAYEVQTIANVLGATPDAIILRSDATEARLKQVALDQYKVIHFATHGLVAGELGGLDEPALVLTLPSRPSDTDDGLLTASEIAALKISADWVVLSACNTAAGSTTGAEALSGLARAFFYAGARGLLVSHWAVESEAAVLLTTHTFARMARTPTLGRAEAFRRTMLSLADGGRPPSYWAPFIIVGEGAPARRK